MFASSDMIRQWNKNGKAYFPTFATNAELDAAVAANGGQSLGPAVSVAGVLWGWSEYGVYAKAGSPPYVGSAIPTATMARKGDLIQVYNPAVPLGRSILRCTGTIWAPPAGEPIAIVAPSSDSAPVALITPGVTTLVQVWATPVIPDYMLPNLLEWDIVAALGAQNTVSQATATMLGVGICGNTPTSTIPTDYPAQRSDVPSSAAFVGISSRRSFYQTRRQGAFKTSNTDGNRTSYDYSSLGPFVSGANMLYVMAKPGHVADSIRFDAAQVYSRGNL